MRDVGVLDVGLVSGIKQDQRIVLQRVVHPLAQFLLGDDRTRRIVGEAEVDDIHGTPFGYFGDETVFCRGGHISHVAPTTVTIGAATAYHHVRVDIDGIDGVGYTDEVVPME